MRSHLDTLPTLSAIENQTVLNAAIDLGIEFLYAHQLTSGEFRTLQSSPEYMDHCTYIPASSPYITSLVLYSLKFMSNNNKVRAMIQKSLAFLIKESEGVGVWRFYGQKSQTNPDINPVGIIPDLDDTACASYALKSNQISVNNKTIILNQRNQDGIFPTWFLDYYQEESRQKPYIYVPPDNDFCCGVNANILLYLGENEGTKSVCNYLNHIVLNDQEENNCSYFPNVLVLYYLISRAYCNGGAKSLSASKHVIIEKIVSILNSYWLQGLLYKNSLHHALAVCTVLGFDGFRDNVHDWINRILREQTPTGYWSRYSFFTDANGHYGSEELTTAICLEALTRYRQYCHRNR